MLKPVWVAVREVRYRHCDRCGDCEGRAVELRCLLAIKPAIYETVYLCRQHAEERLGRKLGRIEVPHRFPVPWPVKARPGEV